MIIFDFNPDLALVVLRLGVGIVFLAHGPAKLMKSKEMAQGLGMDANLVMLVGLMETLGALSVLLGVWIQVGAILLGLVMLGSTYFKTQKWSKKFTGENGWELDFMLLTAAVTLLFAGPGAFVLF